MNKGEHGAALSHHPAHSHHPQPSPYSPPQERQTPSSFSSSSLQDFHNSSFAYSGSVAKHLANATAAGLRSIQELPPAQQHRQSPASSKSSSSSTSSSPSDIYAYPSFLPPHHPHAPPHHQQVVVEDEEDQPHPLQHQDHYYHRYQQPSSSTSRYPPRHHHDHYHPHHYSQRFEGAFFSEGGAGDAAAHPSHYDPHLSPYYSHLHHHPKKHIEGEAFHFTHQPPSETRTSGEEESYAIAPRFHSNEVDHRYHQNLNGYVVEELENEEEGEEETGKTATVTVKPEKSSSSLSSSPSAADTFAARLHRQANKKKKKDCDVNEKRAKQRRPRGKLQGEERAKQNREASRRYRQRKKELLMHMKKEIQRLLHEKASLLKQQESTLSIINRLQNQNMELQQEHKHQAKQLEKERLSWVRRLVKAMHDDTTTEQELNHIVNTVGAYCVRICNLSQSHINWLLSPGTAKELLKAGYFDSEAARVEHPEREESYASFVQKLMKKISELDEEQIRRLQDAVHQHYEKLVPIQEQRFELIDELRALVQQTEEDSIGEEKADEGEEEEEDEGGLREAFQDRKFCKAMKMLCTLEMLRDNFQREADQCRQDMANLIMNVLRLQQRARFFTEVEFVHISVMQLKSVWAQLHPSLPSDYREPSAHLPPRYLYPQILPLKHAEAEDGNGDGCGGDDGDGDGGVDNDEECS
ncbi:Histidine-rich glycoprotein-like [Balamuthia mandrillaris]